MPQQQRLVIVGKGRRLTLAELYNVSRINSSSCNDTVTTVLHFQPSTTTTTTPNVDDNNNNNKEKSSDDTGVSAAAAAAACGETAEMELVLLLQEISKSSSSSSSANNNNNSDSYCGFLSVEDSLAVLTVLAFTLSQGRVLLLQTSTTETPATTTATSLSEQLSERLVFVVNVIKKNSISSSSSSFFQLPNCIDDDLNGLRSVLSKLLLLLLPPQTEKQEEGMSLLSIVSDSTLIRCIDVAITGRYIFRCMNLIHASLPIAALSVDVSGYASQWITTTNDGPYSEFVMDVLRPHRSMVQSASVMRAFLNDTRYTTKIATTEDDSSLYIRSLRDIPQYHGPTFEDMKAINKRFELELNSQPHDAVAKLDECIILTSQKHCMNAMHIHIQKSYERRRMIKQQEEDTSIKKADSSATSSSSSTTLRQELMTCVDSLQTTLQEEASYAVSKVQEETSKAIEDARQKEAAKSVRAAEVQQQQAQQEASEFEGMSEAQKAKILKKRAEKEAKAAAKKKAKEQKGPITLFGAGTSTACQILNDHNCILSIECCESLLVHVDKLLSGGIQRKPKIPKGTRDYLPEQMNIRQKAFDIIRRVFRSHGAVEIDTPIFELKDTLTGKYGEDSKLIYDLADQGGELLALRYDLTVPFARFLALNNVGNIKRYHIGKVYRRDQPALKRGRYREFYQCDFDIAGIYGRMIPDSECLCVVCDILQALDIGQFMIKLNHRRLLDAILDICGVPADKFRTICSAVDKLDKEPWTTVKDEMVNDKGITEHVADRIGTFVLRKGEPDIMYKELIDSNAFGNHEGALTALEDLRILFDYLRAMDKLQYMSFDLSLARGLDYYTGVIYEAVCIEGDVQVGSIGGGGRYDYLVSMFQEAGRETPCVGVSVGIERVFTLMENKIRKQSETGSIKTPNVQILVASAGTTSGGGDCNPVDMMKEKMKICRLLWNANISAEYTQQENAKLKKELTLALDRGIPYMIIIGEEELKQGKCNVKDLIAKTEDLVNIGTELITFLRDVKGIIPIGCEFATELLTKERQRNEQS